MLGPIWFRPNANGNENKQIQQIMCLWFYTKNNGGKTGNSALASIIIDSMRYWKGILERVTFSTKL